MDSAAEKIDPDKPHFEKLIPYYLNSEFIWKIKCELYKCDDEFESKNDVLILEADFYKIFKKIRDEKITAVDPWGILFITFKTSMNAYKIKPKNCNYSQILNYYLTLMNTNAEALGAKWYLFSCDLVLLDINQKCFQYHFFIVSDKSIIIDSAFLSFEPGSDLANKVLAESEYVHGSFEIAYSKWIYNKFYTETKWGQIYKIYDDISSPNTKKISQKESLTTPEPNFTTKEDLHLQGMIKIGSQLQTIKFILVGVLIFWLLRNIFSV